MAKIRVATFDKLKPGPPDSPAERASSGVGTEVVFDGARDAIHVRLHHLLTGETLSWHGSATGYLCYVWEGAIHAGEKKLAKGSVVMIEHGGSVEVRAEEGGATLLVFNVNAAVGEAPARAGGHVHLLPAERVARDKLLDDPAFGAAIFADSGCPTCELWLHENTFFDAGFLVAPHSHSEDEVIVVISGEIVLGQRPFGRGTAILIAKDTIYSFHTGKDGLQFINFRPSPPTYNPVGSELMLDEQAFYLEKLGHPTYINMPVPA